MAACCFHLGCPCVAIFKFQCGAAAVDDEVVGEVVLEVRDVFRSIRCGFPLDGDGVLGVVVDVFIGDKESHCLAIGTRNVIDFQSNGGGGAIVWRCPKFHDQVRLFSVIGIYVNLACHVDGSRVLENEPVSAFCNREFINRRLVR